MAAVAVKRYKLRLYISPKHITANVRDHTNNGKIVAETSTVEHAIRAAFDIGKTANAKAGAVVAEVLARRLKIEGLGHHQGMERGIHADVRRDIEKKKGVDCTMANSKIVWAIINGLRRNGVKIVVDDDCVGSD